MPAVLLFVNSCIAYVTYDQRKDFVIDFDQICSALQINKANLKRVLNKHLKKNVDYKSGVFSIPENSLARGVFINPDENPRGGRPSEQILLTPYAFKKLCMRSESDKVQMIHEYYIAMEEIVLKYTQQKMMMLQTREQALLKEKEEALTVVATQEEELRRFQEKKYEEVEKHDHVYIHKEQAELHSDRHKIGKAIDTSRRESQFNTGSAQGGKMIYTRATHNAKLVEDIIKDANRRYWYRGEHYNCRSEHTVDLYDIACAVTDTLASSFEFITRADLYDHVIAKLIAEKPGMATGQPRDPRPSSAPPPATTDPPVSNVSSVDTLLQEFTAVHVKPEKNAWFRWEDFVKAFVQAHPDVSLSFPKKSPTFKDRFIGIMRTGDTPKDVTDSTGKKLVNVRCFKHFKLI